MLSPSTTRTTSKSTGGSARVAGKKNKAREVKTRIKDEWLDAQEDIGKTQDIIIMRRGTKELGLVFGEGFVSRWRRNQTPPIPLYVVTPAGTNKRWGTVTINGKEIGIRSHAATAHRRCFCLAQPDIREVYDHVISSRYNAIYGDKVMSPNMVRRVRQIKGIKSDFGQPSRRRKPLVLNWRSKLLEQSWR